jgi:dTDP-4-dehydrorhamnose 3,5-epimerase
MKVSSTELSEIKILEPQIFRDERGFFYESFNNHKFNELVSSNTQFVQDNHSKSAKGVLRGLHYQMEPYAQGKLVRVIHGEVFDVAVDIREDSKTYGRWVGLNLSSENKKMIWIPEGFAHGFLVLSDHAEVNYKTTNYYSKEHERVIHWKDNNFNIKWPEKNLKIITSDKDNKLNGN